jgi:hypothetical protein
MTAFIIGLALALAWVVGTGMILLLGWKQDGRVRPNDAVLAVFLGLAFWPILFKEMYDTWRAR